MPKDQTLLAPLWDVQNKAISVVTGMDVEVFLRLGLFIDRDTDSWMQDLKQDLRDKNEEQRVMTIAQLRVYSQRARMQNAPARLDEMHDELMGKFVAVNSQLDQLTDMYGTIISWIPGNDPRRKIVSAEVDTIESSMVDIRESVEELRDEVPPMTKALGLLSLPRDQFEDALGALNQPLGLPAAVAEVVHAAERLAKLRTSIQKNFKDIQAIVRQATDTWLDSRISRSQQRKVLRDAQNLLSRMQVQEQEQGDILTEMEGLKEKAIKDPISLTHATFGSIKVSDLLSAMKDFAYMKQTKTTLITMLDTMFNKVGSFVEELRPLLEAGGH